MSSVSYFKMTLLSVFLSVSLRPFQLNIFRHFLDEVTEKVDTLPHILGHLSLRRGIALKMQTLQFGKEKTGVRAIRDCTKSMAYLRNKRFTVKLEICDGGDRCSTLKLGKLLRAQQHCR